MTGSKPVAPAPPASDEIEISVFGPGCGESVVVHLGNGDWMVVDSCLDDSGTPVPISYLEGIGISPKSAVRLAVATHWHDDHIIGLAKVLSAAPKAHFAITAAFDSRDFRLALAPWLAGQTLLDGKGLDEIRRIMESRAPAILAGENKVLWERQREMPCQVRALSPSDPAVLVCIAQLQGTKPGSFRRRMPRISGNDASVVLSIQVGQRRILLGGDLENRANRSVGWLAVVDAQIRSQAAKHHVFKIPHHGSANAHHEEVWQKLLHPNPFSAVAPFVKGSVSLPTLEDRNRIVSLTEHAFLTSCPGGGRFRFPVKAVEKTMREAARKLEVIPRRFGHVCLRGRHSDGPEGWTVTLRGDAIRLGEMQ